MNPIQAYLDFIFRPLPVHPTPKAYEVMPNFYYELTFWTCIFTFLFKLIPYTLKQWYPQWYSQLNSRKQFELPAYIVCTLHHFYAVPRSWYHIYVDYWRNSTELTLVHYSIYEGNIAPFTLGYFLADTVCYCLEEMFRGRYEYLLHHILSAWLVISSLYADGHLMRYIPHLLFCDSSNLFFNIAWILRTTSYQHSSIVLYLELLFLFFFFIARVINLQFVFVAILSTSEAYTLGWSRLALIPIGLMQFYWFYKIVSSLFTRNTQKKSKNKDTKELSDENDGHLTTDSRKLD